MSVLGVPTSGTIGAGEVLDFDLAIARGGKYVVELTGPAQVQFGIWQGVVAPGTGKLRVCGVGAWGCRSLDPAGYCIQVTGLSAGAFSFVVRAWSIWDYWYIGGHKSTC